MNENKSLIGGDSNLPLYLNVNKDDVELPSPPVVMSRNQCSGHDLVEVIGVEPPGGATL